LPEAFGENDLPQVHRFEWRTQDHNQVQRSVIELGSDGRAREEKRFSPLWEDSESGRKKKYNAPQFAKLTPEEAKAMLTARGLPDGPVARQLLEWVAELEKRPDKK